MWIRTVAYLLFSFLCLVKTLIWLVLTNVRRLWALMLSLYCLFSDLVKLQTSALDGETDLKTRVIPSACMGIDFELLQKIKAWFFLLSVQLCLFEYLKEIYRDKCVSYSCIDRGSSSARIQIRTLWDLMQISDYILHSLTTMYVL